MVTVYVLYLILFSIFPVCFCDGDFMEECAEQEICHTPSGVRRATYCVNLLSKRDMDIIMEIFPEKLTNKTTVLEFVEEGCTDIQKMKDALYVYYYEKEKMNIVYTPEESRKIVESRACLTLMITECQLKKPWASFHLDESNKLGN